MSNEEQIDPPRTPEVDGRHGRHGRPESPPITPDDEPSALERGVRIFERLRRRR